MLDLVRPLVFFDLETTGLNITRDRIVEIALLKIHPDQSEETFHTLVNPEIPIPPEASAVHGITDEDVANAPTFFEVAKRVALVIENCDLAGYNCNRFDIPMLAQEFHRVGVPIDLSIRKMIDVQVIYHKKEPRTLSAAYKYYTDNTLQGAHSADADTRATYEVLKGQLKMYDDLPRDVDALHHFTKLNDNVDLAGRMVWNENHQEVFNFGKYKDRLVEEVFRESPGYFEWMMNSDFPSDTKMHIQRIKIRVDGGLLI